jgi:peptidoglycan/LPS O-acetylase OafA/YrhL
VELLNSLPQTIKKTSTIAVLDGVRAYACFSVIAYHINHLTQGGNVWTYQGVGPIIYYLALSGSSGVTLFFVLSGFLLFMPYAKSLLFDAEWPSARRYYVRRIFRIWPGYYISLALLIVFLNREYLNPDHWRQLGLFLTFLMDSTQATYQAINGPFWTLAVEWQFYMLLPLIALALRWIVRCGSLQRRLNLVFLCLLGLIVWGLATRYWGSSWRFNPDQPGLLPEPIHHIAIFFLYGRDGKFMEDFAVGMIASVIYTLAQQRSQHRLGLFCKKYSLFFWVSGVADLVFAAIWPGTFLLNPLKAYIGAHMWLFEILLAFGFGLCIIALLFGPAYLKRVFEWRPVRGLGQLSYGMYIWHLPIIFLFSSYVIAKIHFQHGYVQYSLYWVLVVCVIIPFSYIFHRVIEQPWIRIGSQLTSPKKSEA